MLRYRVEQDRIRIALDPHFCHSSEFGSGCESEAWRVKFWHVLAFPTISLHKPLETRLSILLLCWITLALRTYHWCNICWQLWDSQAKGVCRALTAGSQGLQDDVHFRRSCDWEGRGLRSQQRTCKDCLYLHLASIVICCSNMFAPTRTFDHHLASWGIKSPTPFEQYTVIYWIGD